MERASVSRIEREGSDYQCSIGLRQRGDRKQNCLAPDGDRERTAEERDSANGICGGAFSGDRGVVEAKQAREGEKPAGEETVSKQINGF